MGLSETAVETDFTTLAEYLQAHPTGLCLSRVCIRSAAASPGEVKLPHGLINWNPAKAKQLWLLILRSRKRRIFSRSDDYYQSYLGRAADPAGSQYALGLLQHPSLACCR